MSQPVSSFLRTFAEPEADLQAPADVAVIVPTVLRPGLKAALQSVFQQSHKGRIQILVGVDKVQGDPGILDEICLGRPANVVLQVYYPGYSTSARHGGLSSAWDGGVLRCILTHLANARYVAYLDDDNWWQRDHLSRLLKAIRKADWAYALRWFVHPVSMQPVCIDDWESVGPDRGVFPNGFVDPNCLMFDKLACESVIQYWNIPLPGDTNRMTADRNIFANLRARFVGAATGKPSVHYLLGPSDPLHAARLKRMGALYEQAGGADPPSSGIPGAALPEVGRGPAVGLGRLLSALKRTQR